jgi:hypothetical protein
VWKDRAEQQADGASLQLLRDALAERGTRLSLTELRFALGPDAARSLPAFIDRLVPMLGGQKLRLHHAFEYLAEGAARISVERFSRAFRHFIRDKAVLCAIAEELDADGDCEISLDDFRRYHLGKGRVKYAAYRAQLIEPTRIAAGLSPAPVAPAAPVAAKAVSAQKRFAATSPLQLQIGFFRLLQGAAYRSFRESYSANAETHLRAQDLPYTIPDFGEFVAASVDFYLFLGVTEKAEEPEFHHLTALVAEEIAALDARINGWGQVDKTFAMLNAEALLDRERDELHDHQHRFDEMIEYALALRMHDVPADDIREDSLAGHERNQRRHAELQTEHGHAPATDAASDDGYLGVWNPVIMAAEGERPDGAIMPVRFWYERFMPQLLRCVSPGPAADQAALDRWHTEKTTEGAFDGFATDLRDGFAACTPDVKLSLQRAWRLTEHYMNGVEKRREREEFGRESGYLSQYVSFIDTYLGRSDVAKSEMRISFPYYIGPAVWCLLHTAAELIEGMESARRADAITKFTRFFKAFATMYPCPYCRHHLNRYVVRNREVQAYPVEFLLLGQNPDNPLFEISLEDRLTAISAEVPGSARLFVWKLHNAVSSSIARSEEWFHQEERPLYTTRFWPGLDAEIARARALEHETIDVDRLAQIYEVLKPATRLATLRDEIRAVLSQSDAAGLDPLVNAAQQEICALEAAVVASDLLSRTYGFDPTVTLDPPHFSEKEEAFARSGLFVER